MYTLTICLDNLIHVCHKVNIEYINHNRYVLVELVFKKNGKQAEMEIYKNHKVQ